MKKFKSPPSKHSFTFKAIGLVVIAAIVVTLLEVTNTTHLFHKAKQTVSIIPSTHPASTTAPATQAKKTQTNNSYSSANQSASTKSTAPTSSAGSDSTAAPVTPTGDFVSDHQPNLSGSPHPSQENSVCVTTPGATCYIEFTQGGIVKQLSTQTADANGAVYWTWDIAQDDFTTGSWQITATASLNGKTTTSTDPEALVIKQ